MGNGIKVGPYEIGRITYAEKKVGEKGQNLAAIALVMGQIQKLIGEVLVEISSPLSAHL